MTSLTLSDPIHHLPKPPWDIKKKLDMASQQCLGGPEALPAILGPPHPGVRCLETLPQLPAAPPLWYSGAWAVLGNQTQGHAPQKLLTYLWMFYSFCLFPEILRLKTLKNGLSLTQFQSHSSHRRSWASQRACTSFFCFLLVCFAPHLSGLSLFKCQ